MTKTNQELFEKHADDFAYCETVIKKYSKSFYQRFLNFLKKKQKVSMPFMLFVAWQMIQLT